MQTTTTNPHPELHILETALGQPSPAQRAAAMYLETKYAAIGLTITCTPMALRLVPKCGRDV